jgi:hypothetical protein
MQSACSRLPSGSGSRLVHQLDAGDRRNAGGIRGEARELGGGERPRLELRIRRRVGQAAG